MAYQAPQYQYPSYSVWQKALFLQIFNQLSEVMAGSSETYHWERLESFVREILCIGTTLGILVVGSDPDNTAENYVTVLPGVTGASLQYYYNFYREQINSTIRELPHETQNGQVKFTKLEIICEDARIKYSDIRMWDHYWTFQIYMIDPTVGIFPMERIPFNQCALMLETARQYSELSDQQKSLLREDPFIQVGRVLACFRDYQWIFPEEITNRAPWTMVALSFEQAKALFDHRSYCDILNKKMMASPSSYIAVDIAQELVKAYFQTTLRPGSSVDWPLDWQACGLPAAFSVMSGSDYKHGLALRG